MPNTSATGGYLTPTSSVALNDDALDDFLQAVVVGVTGMPGATVRPRWQPEPPNLPQTSVGADGATVIPDWAAIGIIDVEPDFNAAVMHQSAGNGDDILLRQEILTLMTSFYGPNAGSNCALLRDGLQIAQNREVLQVAGYGVIETGNPRQVPVQIKDIWWRRVDMQVRIRRQVQRIYPVLNLVSAAGTINNQVFVDSFHAP